MPRCILIRFQTGLDLEPSRVCVEDLLQLELEEFQSISENKMKTNSFSFNSLGLNGSIYHFPVDPKINPKLEGYDFVIDIALYADLCGKMYETHDPLAFIAEFIGSMVKKKFDWPYYLCTEDNFIFD